MSRTTSTKRKGGENLPDPPAKKSKTNSAAENKPVKKAKVATSTASDTALHTATATALDNAAPSPLLKAKNSRKTAADFLSDDDGAEAVVNKSKATKKSKKDIAATSDAVVDLPNVAKQSKDKVDAPTAAADKPKASKKSKKDVAATSDAIVDQPRVAKQSKDEVDAPDDNPKATKKSKKVEASAADAVVDNPKIVKKIKANNVDDLAASRQLRTENGEPVTPAAPAVLAAKKIKKAEKARNDAEAAAVLQAPPRKRAEKPRLTEKEQRKADKEEAATDEYLAKHRQHEQDRKVALAERAAARELTQKATESEKSKTVKDDQDTAIAKKKSGKMNSNDPTTDLVDEVEPTKKAAGKTKKVNTNGVSADDKGETEIMEDKTEDLTTAEDTTAVDDLDLLKGFDSDTSDDAQDEGLDIRETPPITDPTGKIEKKLREANRKAGLDDEPGTIYIGHIPHGFFEVQMRAFFSQFGDITRIRLSRNRRTGASKHFAFIEFASAEVAKIAAKTMDGYLMFGQILKSKFAPADSLHPDLWKGANKKFHKIPHAKLEGQKLAEPKSVEQWDKKAAKEEARRKKKGKAIKEKMGYEAPAPAVAEAKAAKKEKKEL